MIANVRIVLDMPEERVRAALEREEPGMSRRMGSTVRQDREQIAGVLDDFVKDNLPDLLGGAVHSYEVEVDW